jgi:hypothetical protein
MLSSPKQTLSPEDFKRRFGVQRSTLEKMVEAFSVQKKLLKPLLKKALS